MQNFRNIPGMFLYQYALHSTKNALCVYMLIIVASRIYLSYRFTAKHGSPTQLLPLMGAPHPFGRICFAVLVKEQRGLRGLLCRWPSITEWEVHITAQGHGRRN